MAQRRLTVKQKKWADKRLETGNGTKAALEVYDTQNPEVAASISSENLRKPQVIEYLQSRAERSAIRVEELAEKAQNESVKLNANKDILDRAGFKPVDKQVSLTMDAELTQNEGGLAEVLSQLFS